MAEIISHPMRNENWQEERFELAEGTVIIRTKDGTDLTLAKSVFWLQSVLHHIMDLSKK